MLQASSTKTVVSTRPACTWEAPSWLRHRRCCCLRWYCATNQGYIVLNTLRAKQNCRHFADDIFKCISWKKIYQFRLIFHSFLISNGQINNIPALVQIMTCRGQVTNHYLFDHSHGAGTSSPSHWQQVEEQAPKPVGWTMCFLLMTLVPVQKLCVNIYVYIYMCVHSLYEFCYKSYIQRECHSVLAKLHPITFYRGMRGSWSECHFVFSLVYQLCLALW